MTRAFGRIALGLGMALAGTACSADSGNSGSGRMGSGGASGGGMDPFGNTTTGGGDFGNTTAKPHAGAAGDGADPTAGGSCASIEVEVTRRPLTAMVVVDGSGSMEEAFGASTRWNELKKALVDPAVGLITELESAVSFGLTIYQRADAGTCPQLTQVPIALNNYMAINATYQMVQPNGGTPTGEALMQVVGMLPDLSAMPMADPVIIILATDGLPNGCGDIPPAVMMMCPNVPPLFPGFPAGPDPFCIANALANLPPDFTTTIAATQAAQMKGIDTYVISLAPGLQQTQDLQRVANLGLGMDEMATPGAPIFEPMNPDVLRDALLGIIGGAVGCTFELQGTLKIDQACTGTVTLNGMERDCGGADGWRPVDETHIELVGAACMEFQKNPIGSLSGHWPCGVIVPF